MHSRALGEFVLREVGKVWPGRNEFIEIELELDKADLSINESL